MAYTSMLNAFLNVMKFACGTEPKQRPKTRRGSSQFLRKSNEPPVQQLLEIIYPGRVMNIQSYLRKVDSLVNRRNRLTHPRDIDELSEEVHRFSTMLEDHQRCGDVLDSNENLFLDVFSGIDKLQACGIGGLSMQT